MIEVLAARSLAQRAAVAARTHFAQSLCRLPATPQGDRVTQFASHLLALIFSTALPQLGVARSPAPAMLAA
ncbi:hypothetical protein ABQZ08_01750 [Xanthomonas hortorum pv. hederae]